MTSEPFRFSIRPRRRNDGFTLECGALLPAALWYRSLDHAVSYAKHRAGSQRATIEVFDASGKMTEAFEHSPAHRDNVLGKI